jgi:hypothetical protein
LVPRFSIPAAKTRCNVIKSSICRNHEDYLLGFLLGLLLGPCLYIWLMPFVWE